MSGSSVPSTVTTQALTTMLTESGGVTFNWGSTANDAGDEDFFGGDEGARGEDNEQEDDTTAFGEVKRDAVVFLVDCAPAMFQPSAELDGTCPFSFAMRVIRQFAQDKIIANDQDLMCVVFYGTREIRSANKFAGIFVAADMDHPSAGVIGMLDCLAKDPARYSYGHYEDGRVEFPFADALWAANTLFTAAAKASSKRLFLLTCNDSPNASEPAKQDAAHVRGDDLAGLNIEIEPFFFNPPGGRPFDVRRFYARLLPFDEEAMGDDDSLDALVRLYNPITKLSDMQMNIRRKEYKKRSVGTVPLTLSPGCAIGFKLYNLVMPTKKPPPVRLALKTNAPLKVQTTYVSSADGAPLAAHDIVTGVEYGLPGEHVRMTKLEMAALKRVAEPSLALLGFKDRDWLKPYYQLSHSHFLHPDDESIAGSVCAFAALLSAMLSRGKIALARLIQARAAEPKLVALLPQGEEAAAEPGAPPKPAGFHVIQLPFAEDLRPLELAVDPAPSASQIAAAKVLVRAMTVANFSSDAFLNPSLQRHYAVLQAKALDEQPVLPEDTTLPNAEAMAACAPYASAFEHAMTGPGGFAGLASGTRKAPAKRKRDDGDDAGAVDGEAASPARKKVKKEAGAAIVLNADTTAEALAKLTIPELKELLAAHGAKGFSSLKKADLVDRAFKLAQQGDRS